MPGLWRTAKEYAALTVLVGFLPLSLGAMALMALPPGILARLQPRIHGQPASRIGLLLWIAWILLFDKNQPRRGGRPIPWIRRAPVWTLMRSYFSAKLVRSEKVDPEEKYVIGIHPHGLIGISAWLSVISDAGAFPGLNYRVLTLAQNFRLPIWRDFLLAMGLVSASRDSVSYLLRNNISVAIVLGGAREALDSHPGTHDLTLNTRLGFVRLAIENGASLIPVYGFRESDVFETLPNPPGSTVRRVQDYLLSVFGYSLPIIMGVGFMPKRVPITTVIGDPIPVRHNPFPTVDEVLEVHGRYVDALEQLYFKWVDVADPDRKSDFRVVDRMDDRKLRRLARTLESKRPIGEPVLSHL